MDSRTLDNRRLPQLRRTLLRWYDENRRDLPWRNTRDPYRVWISEIMLQQTRVAAVRPRYDKFLQRFPSVEKLASARLAFVLAEWSGLGYYRRARCLHAAAKVIARERHGSFPQSSEDWRKLPGIGRYTAAAIASIAFDEPVAVLDGNVERVLRRLLHSAHSNRHSWSAAQRLLDRERPGDFNQAIMELGATICLPGEPRVRKMSDQTSAGPGEEANCEIVSRARSKLRFHLRSRPKVIQCCWFSAARARASCPECGNCPRSLTQFVTKKCCSVYAIRSR